MVKEERPGSSGSTAFTYARDQSFSERQDSAPWHMQCFTAIRPRSTVRSFKGGLMNEVTSQRSESPQQKFFRVTDNIPEESWYWAALASIGVSAALRLAGRQHWSLFVGQWPPTLILFGLYHRLIHPSTKS